MKVKYISESMLPQVTAERTQQKDRAEAEIYHENLDELSIRKFRKESQKTWTEADQAEYDKAYNKCLELIAALEPVIPDYVKVISDEEYAKMEEEERKKREAEEEAKRLEEEQRLLEEQQSEPVPLEPVDTGA